MNMMPEKLYLGDAVYAEVVHGGSVKLTAENGYAITDTIYLEPHTLAALLEYIDCLCVRKSADVP